MAQRFSHLTNGALKAYAARVVVQLERASGNREQELRSEVATLRDEMIHRLRGHGGPQDGGAGVREPRDPRPNGSATSATLKH
jgi:hypothetical protein